MEKPFEIGVANSDKHFSNYDDLTSIVCVCSENETNVSRNTDHTPHENDSVSLGLSKGDFSAKLAATSGRKLSVLLISVIGISAVFYIASGVGIAHAIGILAISGYTIRTLTCIALLSS